MILDSFITTIAEPSKHREYCFELAKNSLLMSGMVPMTIRAPLFHRFLAAEYTSKSGYYVVSDDDVISMSPDGILNIIERIKELDRVGILCMAPKKMTLKAELGEQYLGSIAGGVHEVRAPKGIMVIKKGILPVTPESWKGQKMEPWTKKYLNKGIMDTEVIGMMVREQGYKVAMDTNNYFHHLGEGYSTILQENNMTLESMVTFG